MRICDLCEAKPQHDNDGYVVSGVSECSVKLPAIPDVPEQIDLCEKCQLLLAVHLGLLPVDDPDQWPFVPEDLLADLQRDDPPASPAETGSSMERPLGGPDDAIGAVRRESIGA